MTAVPFAAADVAAGNYAVARFNPLRHGILSRYTVLPWEDQSEYQALIDALVAEHTPRGPTEEHLVEELAGIIWRKRRLRLAEAAIFRERLRKEADSSIDRGEIAGAALLAAVLGLANEHQFYRAPPEPHHARERDAIELAPPEIHPRHQHARTRSGFDGIDP